jgi:hypothetical protein
MALLGKGFWIWKIPNCEGGNPQSIANLAVSSGFTHVPIKIADGTAAYNIDKTTGNDLVLPLVQALHAQNIQVWGWHYVYGDNPTGEAHIAIQRVQSLKLDGYIIDAEIEYEKPGMGAAARQFMQVLRGGLPSLPVALSSSRFPSYHPTFPWTDFLNQCDLNMPQVYWVEAHNAGSQLTQSVREFTARTPYRPIFPAGIACYESGWCPSPSDITDFLNTATNLNLPGVNFWDWSECRAQLPNLFDLIAKFPWPVPPSNPDTTQQYINALNANNLDQIVALYQSTAIHIDARQTIQGLDAIRQWYTNLLQNILPKGKFTLTSSTTSGTSRHITWQATSSRGSVSDGMDTIGLIDNKISYHYTAFTPPSS